MERDAQRRGRAFAVQAPVWLAGLAALVAGLVAASWVSLSDQTTATEPHNAEALIACLGAAVAVGGLIAFAIRGRAVALALTAAAGLLIAVAGVVALGRLGGVECSDCIGYLDLLVPSPDDSGLGQWAVVASGVLITTSASLRFYVDRLIGQKPAAVAG